MSIWQFHLYTWFYHAKVGHVSYLKNWVQSVSLRWKPAPRHSPKKSGVPLISSIIGIIARAIVHSLVRLSIKWNLTAFSTVIKTYRGDLKHSRFLQQVGRRAWKLTRRRSKKAPNSAKDWINKWFPICKLNSEIKLKISPRIEYVSSLLRIQHLNF